MKNAPTVSDPLNEPIHGSVPDGRPPWRDNAYVCFWDPRAEVVGVLHVSTSPNSEGRRSRISLAVRGRTVELVETPADRGSFASDSIRYPLDDTIRVSSSQLEVDLELAPRLEVADYTAGQVIPPLIPDEPQHHFQQVVRVSGSVTLDGETIAVDGDGFRDRTWGYRDESVHIAEYLSFMVVFDDFAVTALRFHDTEGTSRVEGHLLTADGTTPVTAVGATRDASGLLAVGELEVGGEALELTVTGKHGGFWVPMGPVRRGPTLSAYDELCRLRTTDGRDGYGFIEHASLRRIF